MSQLLTAEFITQAKAKLRFNKDKVQIENKAFRLFSKLTSAILFVCCGLVTLQQLIGEHIRCLTPPKEDIRPEALNQYCFIMSTFTLPHLYNKTIGVDVPHPGVGPYDPDEHETRYHAYYQWVPFALFFQAIMFAIPHQLWKSVEGGLLRAYCNLKIVDEFMLKHRYVLNENDESDEAVRNREAKKTTLTKVAEYFLHHKGHNNRYAILYILCEIFNLVIVISNIYLTDAFLGYEFTTYGPDVVGFLSDDPENRIDPMNRVFPKVTKCKFHKFGPSGGLINYDIMCVLALNIINEKIYTFLWFWFVILSIIGGLALVYRILVVVSSGIRNAVISQRVLETDRDALNEILEKLDYADWFVLRRLSNNINRIRFGELCRSIQSWLSDDSKPRSDSSSPEPYSKVGKLYDDPDVEHPLINP